MATSESRTADQIEADLAAIRQRLTRSIEGLIDQVYPARVKQRAVLGVKTLVADEVAVAKAQVIDPQGNLRTARVAIIGGAFAGLVTLIAVVRKLSRRRSAAPRVGVRPKR